MNSADIAKRIAEFSSDDAAVRLAARETLVTQSNNEVTESIIEQLCDPRQQVRWEAAKALVSIGDPIATMPLMHIMHDDDKDVRWLAAEGLVALGEPALRCVLSALTHENRSESLREGAHHVLHELKKKICEDVIGPVLAAMQGPEPAVSVPVAAYKALEQLCLPGVHA